MSSTVNSTRSVTVARDSNGVRQYIEAGISHDCSVWGSRSCNEFPTRQQIVRGLILLSCFANLIGKQTRSSLHMGMISMEYVYLKLAVFECVSDDKSCSDDFDLA